MSSRSFPSKYENDCPKCGQKILVGSMIEYPTKDSKVPEHEICPMSAAQVAAKDVSPKSGDELFVQIAAWVPLSGVGVMTEAIVKARGGK